MRFVDRDGHPIDHDEWSWLIATGYRLLAQQDVGAWRVVTTWTGVDADRRRWRRAGPAVAPFQTAVFGPMPFEGTQLHWPTEAAAAAGHERTTSAVWSFAAGQIEAVEAQRRVRHP